MSDNPYAKANLVNLSRYQLDVLEECLLTRLTLMTKAGWCWFREEERGNQ
jgi:hypothetical protein